MRRPALLLIVVALLSAAAQAEVDGLQAGDGGTVSEVIDGDTVVLDDGREVRLVGIQAPKLPLGRSNFSTWPLADAAKAALAAICLDRRVELGFGGSRMDRHGRTLAQIERADGLWVQGEMLRRGLARVYSFFDNRAMVDEMLALEREARSAGRGIWADPFYRVLEPEETGRRIDSFQLVEGRVLDAAVVRGRGYLNFGADRRTDFTLVIPPDSRRLFETVGVDVRSYEGRRVRVRGWLQSFNGPMIEVTHPEQIEVLDP